MIILDEEWTLISKRNWKIRSSHWLISMLLYSLDFFWGGGGGLKRTFASLYYNMTGSKVSCPVDCETREGVGAPGSKGMSQFHLIM